MRVLLVEDDHSIGDGIKKGLDKYGIGVDWVRDGAMGQQATEAIAYDAIVLDLSLPGADGLDILQRWRQSGRKTPVLILTARGTLEQRVKGLNLGADDYMGKPFALEELAARLSALVRRSCGESNPCLSHGRVRFDPVTRTVFLADAPIALGAKAISLVELFLRNKRRIFSKKVLEDNLYAWGEEVNSNAVEVHIHNIRRKLGASFIKTVYGMGYLLGDPV